MLKMGSGLGLCVSLGLRVEFHVLHASHVRYCIFLFGSPAPSLFSLRPSDCSCFQLACVVVPLVQNDDIPHDGLLCDGLVQRN